jgi:hypothetical protein
MQRLLMLAAGSLSAAVLSWDVTGLVYLKDCHWNMEPSANSVYEVVLLPAVVVGAPQGEEDVVRFKSPHSVLQGEHWGVRVDHSRTGCTQRVQVAEYGIEALVGLVCGAVAVRHEPVEGARQPGSNDKTLESSFDQEPNKGRKRSGICDRNSGRD